jgi:hypothetical protein
MVVSSAFFQAIHIRISRSRFSGNKSTYRHSLPTFIKEGRNHQPKKRRDPHSICMSTIPTISQVHLRGTTINREIPDEGSVLSS